MLQLFESAAHYLVRNYQGLSGEKLYLHYRDNVECFSVKFVEFNVLNMASISSENASAKKTAVKDVQGFIYMVCLISKHQRILILQGILILFCKKEMRRTCLIQV